MDLKKIQDPEVRIAIDTVTDLLKDVSDLLKDFVPIVISDLKVLNERTSRIEEELKITKRNTELIPRIHSLLEDDGIEIGRIKNRIKKLEN